jgi:hypothetical protein
LDRLPNLSARLRDADASTKRLIYDAFDLRVVYGLLFDEPAAQAQPKRT